MRFAHLKTHHGFERLRLKGLSRALDGFPSRSDCAEPQDPGSAPHPATARARLGVSCVELVAGVASSRRGDRKNPISPTTYHIKRGAKLTAL